MYYLIDKNMLYVDTVFMRGTGLGNRLFPWARSRIFARDHGAIPIQTDWSHIRRGPIFRGGINYGHVFRKIWLFDNFITPHGEISGIQKYLLRQNTTPVLEKDADTSKSLKKDGRIVFAGDSTHFATLHDHHDFISTSLFNSIQPKWQRYIQSFDGADIGINVRLGKDFRKAERPEDFYTKGALLTPVEWFANALQLIRTIVGRNCSAVIVSDGMESDLHPILSLGNVRFLNTPTAVTDLFTLSKVKFMIGSGGSSFSAWASFLGKVPVVSHEGQSFSWFRLHEQAEYLVDVLDVAQPSDAVVQSVIEVLGEKRQKHLFS